MKQSKGLIKKNKHHPKEASHGNSSGIPNSSLEQALIKRKSKPTTTRASALDHKWFSNHMGEEWISLLMIGLHQAYNWTSHCYYEA